MCEQWWVVLLLLTSCNSRISWSFYLADRKSTAKIGWLQKKMGIIHYLIYDFFKLWTFRNVNHSQGGKIKNSAHNNDFPTACLYRGQIYQDNDRFSPQPCSDCVCQRGSVACIEQTCSRPTCDNPITPPGECCPKCGLGTVDYFVFSYILFHTIKVTV